MEQEKRCDAKSKLGRVPYILLPLFNPSTDVSQQARHYHTHTVHLAKKWGEEYSAVCIISSFLVMANFMCQPDSAMGCQDSWSNTIPGCVHEGIFYKITI